MTAILIEKEHISSLHFTQKNTVTQPSKEKQDAIKTRLHLATALGNTYHQKVSIIFNSDEGLKEVRTTVWATTEKYILLKKGVFIPVQQIVDVIL
ncbi:MAG: hypothetical protein R3279_03945 [Putridiphycobacter sp.]|nr:hypothetical protein [Putridiphycobacter sp.]